MSWKPGLSRSEPDLALVERIADVHTAAFREVTGKWRERQTLVRTPFGGTFYPSDVRVFAAVFPSLGLAGRVVEIGSGDGRLLSLLAHLRESALSGITEIHGIEIVPDYIEVFRRARRRLSSQIDYSRTIGICDDVMHADLSRFDTVLCFFGSAAPEQSESALRAKIERELREDARFVSWGPDAEQFELPRRRTVPVSGYHTVHVYGGRERMRPGVQG